MRCYVITWDSQLRFWRDFVFDCCAYVWMGVCVCDASVYYYIHQTHSHTIFLHIPENIDVQINVSKNSER